MGLSHDRRCFDRVISRRCFGIPSSAVLTRQIGSCDTDAETGQTNTARSHYEAQTLALWMTKKVVSFCFPDLDEAFAFVQSLRSGIEFVNLEQHPTVSFCRLFHYPAEGGGTDALTLSSRGNFNQL